jgi:hypothetical protein
MERLLAGNEEKRSDETLATPSQEPAMSPELFAQLTGQRRRRRQSSAVRTFVGIVSAGVIGSAIGYYVLLWILGADGDFLNVAQYLPGAILPGAFEAAPPELAAKPNPKSYTASKEPIPGGDSAVEPARFDAPLTDTTEPAEPSTFATAEATPISDTIAPPIRDARFFSAEQVKAALQSAKSAQAGLVTGDLEDGEAARKAKGASYQKLCGLAEKATFASAASQSSSFGSLRQDIDEFFRETLSDEHTRGEVARIVPIWAAYKDRGLNGVFFAGTVVDHSPQGDVVECRIDLGAGEPLTVLVPQDQAAQLEESARPLAVIGSIVDSPASHVSGYNGDAAQVVWVDRLIRLE